MLATYITQTQQLLQNPAAPTALYATADLTTWINAARQQTAGDGQCIRAYATLTLSVGVQQYNFSSIDVSSVTGASGALNVRTMWYVSGTGQLWLHSRPFEWFGLYELNTSTPQSGAPKVWSQFAQGEAGSLFVSPLPDDAYTCRLDCACYPIPLVDDTTAEAIPAPWQTAVPYFAAYLALLSAQNGSREAEAERMFSRYQEFINRARRFSTSEVLPYQMEQSGNPVRAGQLGLRPVQGAGGGGAA